MQALLDFLLNNVQTGRRTMKQFCLWDGNLFSHMLNTFEPGHIRSRSYYITSGTLFLIYLQLREAIWGRWPLLNLVKPHCRICFIYAFIDLPRSHIFPHKGEPLLLQRIDVSHRFFATGLENDDSFYINIIDTYLISLNIHLRCSESTLLAYFVTKLNGEHVAEGFMSLL